MGRRKSGPGRRRIRRRVSAPPPLDFKIGDGATAWNDLPGRPPLQSPPTPTELDLTTVGDTTTIAITDLIARTLRPPARLLLRQLPTTPVRATLVAPTTASTSNPSSSPPAPSTASASKSSTIAVANVCRLGIYSDNCGLPGTASPKPAATADGTTAGVKDLTIAAAIPNNGLYWLALVTQGAAAVIVNGSTSRAHPPHPI